MAKSESEVEVEEVPAASKKQKKGKKASSAMTNSIPRPDSPSVATIVGTMEDFMNMPSWEDLVQQVDTVEMEPPNYQLTVFFTMCVLCPIPSLLTNTVHRDAETLAS